MKKRTAVAAGILSAALLLQLAVWPARLSATAVANYVSANVSDNVPLSDADIVAADAADLAIGYAEGDSAEQVTRHLNLPGYGGRGTTIDWSSNRQDIIGNGGWVSRPFYEDGDAAVMLTATIRKGSESVERTFPLTVLKKAKETVYRGTEVPLMTSGSPDTDGGVSEAVPVGFGFHFVGNEFSNVYISANGFLTPDDPTADIPFNIIAPFGTDLDHVQVQYKTIGTSPNRKYIVQWTDVDTYDVGYLGTLQAILYETSNEIRFQYRNLDGDNPQADGSDTQIGLQGYDGTDFQQYPYLSSLHDGMAIRFTPDEDGGYSIDDGVAYDPIYLSNDAPSENADLSALSLSGVPLAFDTSKHTYSANVPNSVSNTTVSYMAADPEASIILKMNGAPATNPVALSVGSNTIEVVVTAPDQQTQRTYTITVVRAGPPSTPTPDPTPTPTPTPAAPTSDPEQSANTEARSFDVASDRQAEMSQKDVWEIVVPKGAVGTNGRMTASVVPAEQAPPFGGLRPLSQVLKFTSTTGRTFVVPIRLTFHYDSKSVSSGHRPAVYYFNEALKRWLYIGGTVNPGGGTITVSVNHFTQFAVFDDLPLSFSDMEGHWAAPYTDRLTGMKVIRGLSDGRFHPEAAVTRAEFAQMLAGALGLAGETAGAGFADDDRIPAWARNAVNATVRAGIMKGYEQNGRKLFKANQPITRAEMASMLTNAFRSSGGSTGSTGAVFQDENRIPDWAKASVKAASAAGMLSGDTEGSFRPYDSSTRAEAAAAIYKLLEALHL